jgi:hypothetical protein
MSPSRAVSLNSSARPEVMRPAQCWSLGCQASVCSGKLNDRTCWRRTSPNRHRRCRASPAASTATKKTGCARAKTAGPPSTSFDYAGPLSEMVLVGNLAVRFPNRQLLWDGEKMQVTNVPAANALVRRQHRDGWTL